MCFQATEKLQLMYVTRQGCFSSHAKEPRCGYFLPQVGCHLDVASVFTLTEFRIHGIFQITAMEKKYWFRKLNFFTDIFFPQIQVSPRWPVGSPQLMGRSDVVGHRQTLLRVDNSTQLEHPETLLLGIIRLYTGTVDLLFLMAPLLGRDLLDPM